MRIKKWNRRRRKLRLKHFTDRNRHHLVPVSRGGENTIHNLLLIKIEKHELWHRLWGNRTAEEVLSLLERVVRAKCNQKAA